MTATGTAARGTGTVRVRTEVAALAKTLDYAIPAGWAHDVRVGTRVRVPLHGRTVRGWVVDDDVAAAPNGIDVLPLKSWLGWGPPPSLLDVAEWAAWRWAGPASFFLRTASPDSIVRALPRPPDRWESFVPDGGIGAEAPKFWDSAFSGRAGPTMVRLPPAVDLIDLVLSVMGDGRVRERGGSVVVLVPSAGWAERLAARLTRRGVPATGAWDEARAGWPVVVGSRAAAWTPVPRLAAAVVLDAHDAAYQEESSPTYSAVEVMIERARREGAPCVLASPVPPVALAAHDELVTVAPPPAEERAGWPTLERVDRRGADPRTGLFSEEFVRLARSVLDDPHAVEERGPLVCVYNRTGGARLLACQHCGELARCARCGAAVTRPRDADVLRCPRCTETRPVVCAQCGRLRFKTLRAGVTRRREELAALLGVAVGEVAGPSTSGGDSDALPAEPVLVGTEAVLHRARRAAAVVFLDIDLHLLAPRLDGHRGQLGAGGPCRTAGGSAPGGASLGTGPGADAGARAPRSGLPRGRGTGAGARGGGGHTPRVGPPAVLGARAGLGRARRHVRGGAQRGTRRGKRGEAIARDRVADRGGSLPRAGPRAQAPLRPAGLRAPPGGAGPAGRGGPAHDLTLGAPTGAGGSSR